MNKQKVPIPTTLYRLYGAEQNLLYIGISNQMKNRLLHHRSTKSWWPEVSRIEEECYPDRERASSAEQAAIEAEAPPYNTLHHPVRDGALRSANSRQYWRRVATTEA